MIVTMAMAAMFANGLKIAMYEGMIFHKPTKWLGKKLPEWTTKPLFSCIYCMGGFYSLWAAVLTSCNPLHWVLSAGAGIFVSGLLYQVINFIEEKRLCE